MDRQSGNCVPCADGTVRLVRESLTSCVSIATCEMRLLPFVTPTAGLTFDRIIYLSMDTISY